MPRTGQGEMANDIIKGVVITMLLSIATLFIPVIGFVCGLFIPLPVILFRSTLGRKTGAVIPVITIIILLIIIKKISIDIFFISELLLLGFVLGELFELDYSVEKTILFASGVVLITGLAGFLFYANFFDINIISFVSEYVRKNLEFTVSLYKSMEVPEETIIGITNALDRIHYVLVWTIPALAVTFTLFAAWANLLLAKPVLRGRNLFYPDFGHLNRWKAPEFLVWCVIGCVLILLFTGGGLRMLGFNGILILMVIYFLQGIAIVSFFFEKKQFPRVLRYILYVFISLQHMILFLVIGLGLFDMWVDFRKLETKKGI